MRTTIFPIISEKVESGWFETLVEIWRNVDLGECEILGQIRVSPLPRYDTPQGSEQFHWASLFEDQSQK